MKGFLLAFSILGLTTYSFGQNFSGQWKGRFEDKSASYFGWDGGECEYVLELDVQGTQVSGFSYTYFNDDGKRYYTICKVRGTVNPKIKFLEVQEYERTKTNLPKEIKNCFQVHRLNYSSEGTLEKLDGSWKPAPNQTGNCGFGTIELSRRNIKSIYPGFNPSGTTNVAKKENTIAPRKQTPVVAKVDRPVKRLTDVPATKETVLTKQKPMKPMPDVPISKQDGVLANVPHYEKRIGNILKTYQVSRNYLQVELYDNGRVDGDSISVFFNDKIILSKEQLKETPIKLTLQLQEGDNDFVMYAENLGTIPPNTALMVIWDGEKKYEVSVSSDLKKSGTIRFVKRNDD